MKDLIFIISSFQSGGAERVAANLINEISKSYRIHIVTLRPKESDFYKIKSKNVTRDVVQILSKNKLYSNLKRIIEIRKILKHSKARNVISFIDQMNILVLFASIGLKKHIIISERTNPYKFEIKSDWKFLRRLSYPFCGKIVLQTEGVVQWATRAMRINPKKVAVIPNPISDVKENSPAIDDLPKNFILSIGRLDKFKGFEFVIENFRLLKDDFPDYKLVIIGDGPSLHRLQILTRELNINNDVLFLGKRLDVYQFYKNCKLFMLCSKYEGFPNVLLESTCFGAPSLSFDCDFGPRDILPREYLVPYGDVETLYSKSKAIIENSIHKKKFQELSKRQKEKFSIDAITKKWIELFK